MKFVLILSAEYSSESDVDTANLPKLKDLSTNEDMSEDSDNSEALDVSDTNGTEDESDSVLESQELTETEKKSVNDTAKFIVYGVIIALAAVFAFGICALIYWWACHRKAMTDKDSMIANSETQPFIDIRSENTLRKQTLAFEREKSAKNDSRFYLEKGNGNGSGSVGDVYHDIVNSVNENESESGDDMIRHYGAINQSQ